MDQSLTARSTQDSSKARGIPLFRVAGVRIRLDYSWFIIFFLVLASLSIGYFPNAEAGHEPASYWIAGLFATLLFFASILAHELAHALVAIRAGIEVPDITLFLFGGVSRLRDEPKDPGTELRVALAGPAMSFLLAFGFWLAHFAFTAGPWFLSVVVRYLAWINLALGIFNLLPGFPLDGGRVLRAIVWWRTGSIERGTRVASGAGKAFSLALMVLGGVQIFAGALVSGIWLILIALFLRSLAEQGYETVVLRRALQGATVEQVMAKDLVTVSPRTTLRELVDEYLLVHGYHSFPVVEGGRVLGLVSARDLRKVEKERWGSARVDEVMTPVSPDLVIEPDAGLLEALQRLGRTSRGRLLVMRGERLVGLISTASLSRFVEMRKLVEASGA